MAKLKLLAVLVRQSKGRAEPVGLQVGTERRAAGKREGILPSKSQSLPSQLTGVLLPTLYKPILEPEGLCIQLTMGDEFRCFSHRLHLSFARDYPACREAMRFRDLQKSTEDVTSETYVLM